MKQKDFAKRSLSLVLIAAMLTSLLACGKAEEQTPSAQNTTGYTREDKELITQLLGGEESPEALSDEELDILVEELTADLSQDQVAGIVDLTSGQAGDPFAVDISRNPDAYDETGAMTKPFDQVYPELIEKGEVAFSGESLLIKMKSDTLTDDLKAAGVGALEKIVPLEGAAWYKAKLTDGTDAAAALANLRELDEVLLAEYDYEAQTAALDAYTPFDKDREEEFHKNGHNKDQWHFHHCGIVDGYEKMDTQGGDPSVVVAVIDTGVDYDHEDLADNIWVNTDEIPGNGKDDDGNGYIDDYYGVDILAGKGSGDDTNGHGTHVAGIIAARNNNTGVLGIAYNVKIMPVKAAAHNGTLSQSDIAKAILYAYENGAEVINMSFGSASCSIAVQDALATAYTRCVLVASAGNNGMDNHSMPNYPAALTYVLGVMSVDQYGVESAFTNYDAIAFNGLEYELYAPGENIMSTLPENQYGYLSGTSMAAPVVSAFAAILRSEFTDRDKYPTKFIYGQLAATSGITADCCSPRDHGPHNLPQVADLDDALTKLPKPEVNVQDYALFDDPAISEKNNGDGVIDAGETFALGLTLRNRWGMSENTLVTVDTISQSSGLSDPYITIQNPTVDYGSVGTYSTQDAGRIYTDELLTGWENPFYITVSEDCPNDYRFTLNVTVTCENALDEQDTTVYESKRTVDENVRSGYLLPSVIEEDMVLTPDNLYIISKATVIQEGVTVRVEPGTHIQFWTDDPDDPYADSYIAYLVVNGTFLAEGTKENPVYLYPSDLMYRYAVDIGASDTGYVSLKYAELTNFSPIHSAQVNIADHCTFRQAYHTLYYRYVSNGSVHWDSRSTQLNIETATGCVFDKLIGSHRGNSERCIFSYSEIDFYGNYQNCVFLGNRFYDPSSPNATNQSALALSVPEGTSKDTPEILTSLYDENTGTTYILATLAQGVTYEYLRQILGLEELPYAVIETEEEHEWLRTRLPGSYSTIMDVGIRYDIDAQRHVWSDGTPIGDFLYSGSFGTAPVYLHQNYQGLYSTLQLTTESQLAGFAYEISCALYEIPGQIRPEKINFSEYHTYMDMDTTYQIVPRSKPAQLNTDCFLYESSDEKVVTVSDTGLVTPVSWGTADIWVYSADRRVKNYVTVTVQDYVALDGLAFPEDTALMPIGQLLAVDMTFAPESATRRNVTYTSSDETVVSVDETGILTALHSGTATITATCEGLTATLEVTVYQKATTLTLAQPAYTVKLSDGIVAAPQVVTDPGAEPELVWRSTDESVATVEDGDLILKKTGTTTLEVTDRRSGLSASCLVLVSEQAQSAVKEVYASEYYHYVLFEDGKLYYWDINTCTTPILVATDVKDFSGDGISVFVLKKDGTLESWYINSTPYLERAWTDFVGRDILGIHMYRNGSVGYFVYTADGSTYAMGDSNNSGSLGLGTTAAVDTWELVMLEDVTDITSAAQETTFFLTKNGDLYYAGGHNDVSTPTKMAENIARIYPSSSAEYLWCRKFNGVVQKIETNGSFGEVLPSAQHMDSVYVSGDYDPVALGIQNGQVHIIPGQYSTVTERTVPGITNAVAIWGCKQYNGKDTVYIATADGMLYGYGSNQGSNNHFAGATNENPVTFPVVLSTAPLAEETVTVTDSNLVNGILPEDTLDISFNKALTNVSAKLYADGTQVVATVTVENLNRVTVSRSAGFTEGVQYELVFPAGSLTAQGNITNEEIRIAFTYGTVEEEVPEETVPSDPNASDTTDKEDSDISTPFSLRSGEEIHESILDTSIPVISLADKLAELHSQQKLNGRFFHNAVLNPISTDTEVTHWLRLQAPSVSSGAYLEIPLGGNWWGSVNETAIGLQLIDYTDYPNYARLLYAPYLTEAPENTFPFVTSVKLFNKDGEEVTTVGNEKITFQVKFNRDMDTSIPLQVRFGSAYPYGDYEIPGEYVDARTWEGTYTLNTVIENGYQYFTIANGCSATDDLPLQTDQARFFFEIDTTAAQALLMQGSATDTGIRLKWTQDDFVTLMGYNIYRSDSLNGQYERLNSTVIPADTMQWFDSTVEPGQVYYYNFTVVQTDLTESTPSGKISLMSKDTMAPNIYHSPVTSATTGQNLVISATVTDNLNIIYANLYYRTVGTDTWQTVRMNALNDKFSAILPASAITLNGVEYYIEAFDGVSFTYRGSAEAPFAIAVREALDQNSLGDVDSDGAVTVRDALMVLQAISHKYNMTPEEFERADLNGDGQLSAVEALRILHYVSGKVGSLTM